MLQFVQKMFDSVKSAQEHSIIRIHIKHDDIDYCKYINPTVTSPYMKIFHNDTQFKPDRPISNSTRYVQVIIWVTIAHKKCAAFDQRIARGTIKSHV